MNRYKEKVCSISKENKYRVKAYIISKEKENTKLIPFEKNNLEREDALLLVENLKKDSTYCNVSFMKE